jgi:hypothetical protein
MLITDVYSKIGDYITQVVGDQVNNRILYANQAKPRLQKPFITINIRNITNNNLATRMIVTDDGTQKVIIEKSMIVSIEAFSDLLHEAESLLDIIHNYLSTDVCFSIFQDDLAYMTTVTEVTTIPNVLDANIESRAILEIEINTEQEIEDQTGTIETIIIHDEVRNTDIIIKEE